MKECNSIKQSPIAALAAYGGGAGGTTFTGGSTELVYVDDVFSSTLYEGASADQDISTGIDNTDKALIWLRNRVANEDHVLVDSARSADSNGIYYRVRSNSTGAQQSLLTGIDDFRADGFGLKGVDTATNNTNNSYVAWNFKAAPGFFDIVTYTGTGSVQNISHNLGSVPGMIIIKETSKGGESWGVYHRSLAASQTLLLNDTLAAFSSTNSWNSTAPTASVFTVGTETRVNASGESYVAYLFAHDDQSFGTNSDEAIIKCGSWTASGGAATINLGFEPQFVITKIATGAGAWFMFDNMRGMIADGNDAYLRPDDSGAENTGSNFIEPTSTGFDIKNLGNTQDFIYMAIRRPHKPPEAGTDVFAIDTFTGSDPNYISGFPVDFFITREGIDIAGNDQYVGYRLTGSNLLKSNTTDSVISSSATVFDYQDGHSSDTGSASSTKYSWMFKRAPGFLDVLAWSGNNTVGRALPHNLESAPELIIIKSRSSTYDWVVWHKDLTASEYLYLNSTAAKASYENFFNNTTSDASNITFSSSGYVNGSGETYTGALFATLSGISKVGSYTGTGYDVNVDCGFTGGARYILIKRIDSTGDWYVWDSLRGIVSGNDPYLLLNSTAAQVTNTDYVDPLNAGFTVTSSAPAALNTSGGTYLFLAVA